MCFSMKFRHLLGHRMLHTSIRFRLRATYDLYTLYEPASPFSQCFMGSALDCGLGPLPSP